MDKQITTARSVITGVIGFWLGGMLGNFGVYLIAISGIIGWLLGFVPETQPLVRLLSAILLAFTTIGLGGTITGVINGFALARIDRRSDRRRLVLGAAYAYGVGYGILLIPILLLISLIAIYNNGHKIQPQAYFLLFGILGLIYGLVIGLILTLLTISFRRMWLVLLAFIFGYFLAGIVLGIILWRADVLSSELVPLRTILRLLFISLLIDIPVGALVGLAFYRLSHIKDATNGVALAPGHIQQIAVIGVSLVTLIILVGFFKDARRFLTINPAATATQLSSETVGVHWTSPTNMTIISEVQEISVPEISAREGIIAVVWSQKLGQDHDIFYTYKGDGGDDRATWSESVNVSKSPGSNSTNPQVVIDSRNQAHIIWEEQDLPSGASQILYTKCQIENCQSPISLSATSELDCAAGLSFDNSHNPSITIDKSNRLMAAWSTQSGLLLSNAWLADELPQLASVSCVPTVGNMAEPDIRPRLTAGSKDIFSVAYAAAGSDQAGEIYILRFDGEAWSSVDSPVGVGFSPDIMLDENSQTHLSWCDEQGVINYQSNVGSIETISTPSCIGSPALGKDSNGLPHLVWFSDQVENVNGVVSPSKLLYESIRTDTGWSTPAIIAQTNSLTQPSMASGSGGKLHLVWSDMQGRFERINYTHQDPYNCDRGSLSDLGQVALDTILQGGYHPQAYQVPFCDNQFIDFIYQPNPQAAFSSDQPTLNGGFDRVAELMKDAQYEVLFVNMQWDKDENDLSPGFSFAREVADLYQRVKEDPSKYPRGMVVRILLGNYPMVSNLEWGTQIWNVMNDLRDAGLKEIENPELGWLVEVADYAGTYPHSHTKFVVIDGKLLIGAGFNYSWFHLPKDHPSGRGDSLTDLGIAVQGPVAQPAISAYDEMWQGANQLYCPDFYRSTSDSQTWSQTCQWQKAQAWHVPEVLKFSPTKIQQNAFALFRTAVYKEADDTYSAVLSSAQSTIDAIHVNFSLELICMTNILIEDVCTYDNSLPWMRAIMHAVETNHARVRVIVENANSNGLENRVAIRVLQDELAKRGLEGLVEIRFFNGRLHMKSALVDDELLFVGSQNFHYSSFGESGLLEFVVASDDPQAIDIYRKMFEFHWNQALPEQEADWATAK